MSRQKSDECLWTCFKSEFRLENFSLSFEKNSKFLQKDPEEVLEYFHTTIWPCCNRLVYLIYRIVIAIYYTIWFIESIIRNAEYISNDYKLRNKINIFSIHPWPLYMTSWSLTILFAHLWISAFISLYFYSINENSWLNNLFSHLFGPFSCSRAQPESLAGTSTNVNRKKQHKSCFANLFNLKKNSKETPFQTARPSTLTTQITLLKSNNTESYQASDPEIGANQIIFHPKIQNNLDTNAREILNKNSHRTYCINKSLCNIPSAIVISNKHSWKLWIDSHVPNFVLILIKISWLLNNLVVISALIVTCIYFSYAYIFDLNAEPTWVHELGNVHRHGINSLVALVDVIMLGYPIRILHFVYVIIYGWVYAVVTFLYWLQNPKEHVIYDQIDYRNPLKLGICYLFLTILVFLMQVTHFLAYRLKVLIRIKYFDNAECECLNVDAETTTPVSDTTDLNINDVETCNPSVNVIYKA